MEWNFDLCIPNENLLGSADVSDHTVARLQLRGDGTRRRHSPQAHLYQRPRLGRQLFLLRRPATRSSTNLSKTGSSAEQPDASFYRQLGLRRPRPIELITRRSRVRIPPPTECRAEIALSRQALSRGGDRFATRDASGESPAS